MDSSPPPDPVDPGITDDPVCAVIGAHRAGRTLSLRSAGTTGEQHRVVRTTSSWWDSFAPYSDLTGVGPDARLWVPGPSSATMNLFALVHARVVGARVVPRAGEATHACLTPALLDRRGNELAAGTRVVVGGAALPRTLHDHALEQGLAVASYYGAAEVSFVASGPHAGALRPFPGVEVEIRSGVIWARSPYVAAGPGRWSTVGDLGEVRDGLLTVFGRPGTVTTGGATVTIVEVEAALRPGATGDFAVVGVPHPALGQLLAAVVSSAADRESLGELARRTLPASWRPRRWVVLDPLPLTTAGKVDRNQVTALLTSDQR